MQDKEAAKKKLTNDDCVAAADVSAVLHPIVTLIFEVQKEFDGSIAFSFLHQFRTFVLCSTQVQWWVADVDKDTNVDEETRWDAKAKFPKRDFRGRPLDAPLAAKELKGTMETVQFVKKTSEELDCVATELLDRIKDEMKTYFGAPTEDQLLAMACHPFAVDICMQELMLQGLLLNKCDDAALKAHGEDFRLLAREALEKQIRKHCECMLPDKEANASNGQAGAVATADTSPPVDELEVLRRQLNQRKQQQQEGTLPPGGDPIKHEVDRFFSKEFDVRSIPLGQTDPVDSSVIERIGHTRDDWGNDWPLIAEHMDVFDWWERFGKTTYPMMYPIAISILAVPESNDGQERTFSMGTWNDTPLKRRQKDATLQQKAVLTVNKKFIATHKLIAEEQHKVEAANRFKRMIAASATMPNADKSHELEQLTLEMDEPEEDCDAAPAAA